MNSLYLYDDPYQELPSRFWLLTEVSAITVLDETTCKTMLEIAFENDLIYLNFEPNHHNNNDGHPNNSKSNDNSSDINSWIHMLEQAKNFKADQYYNGEMVTEVKDIILMMDPTTLLNFNMNDQGHITKHEILMISTIVNIVLSSQRPECSIVRNMRILSFDANNLQLVLAGSIILI